MLPITKKLKKQNQTEGFTSVKQLKYIFFSISRNIKVTSCVNFYGILRILSRNKL